MKILFLDIDGVCNNRYTSQADGWGIDPYMAFLVGKIKLDTDCEVVLSSAWRFSPEGIEKVEKKVVPLFGCTNTIYRKDLKCRGDEIKFWLEEHEYSNITRYAVLDDENDFMPEQYTHLFKTNFQEGLTKKIADEVTKYLNG